MHGIYRICGVKNFCRNLWLFCMCCIRYISVGPERTCFLQRSFYGYFDTLRKRILETVDAAWNSWLDEPSHNRCNEGIDIQCNNTHHPCTMQLWSRELACCYISGTKGTNSRSISIDVACRCQRTIPSQQPDWTTWYASGRCNSHKHTSATYPVHAC